MAKLIITYSEGYVCIDMPVRMGSKKRYKTFGKAAAAIAKKKGISKKRASAYVAAVSRAQGIDPRTDKKIKRVPIKRKSRRRKK